MRILVYPHDLAVGGSQINAIDLAAGAQAAGHEVVVYGVPGPLTGYIAERGLRFLPASATKYRPAPSRIIELARIARQERIDLIHAYEWPPCLDAYYGASLLFGVPVLCTVLSMSVSEQVPSSVPLIMGTEDLGRQARARQTGPVWVIEPPIDVERDSPLVDGRPFRAAHGIADKEFLIVSVSRHALDLKLDSLVRAIDAVDILGQQHPVVLALVGDGPARAALEKRADAVNRRLGRRAVVLCGQQLDPRSAYAAADLVVAMGSSALRTLAIGRPLIVQGERAFSEIFEPATLDIFLNQGFYGLADDEPGAGRLAAQIERLLSDDDLRSRLADYGRRIVVERFSLERALALQLDIYREVLATRTRNRVTEAVLSGLQALAVELDNHNPLAKRRKKRQALGLLSAAGSGRWPPKLETGA
nr:glycosyltransferase family 4 protein [uncultured Shinella sp.]